MSQTLVTGANRGLGLELVRQLLARGDHVIACCRHPDRADALDGLAADHPGQLSIRMLDMQADDSFDSFANVLSEQGVQLDTLFNNAGVLPSGERFGSIRSSDVRQAFAINALAPLLFTQALAGQLRDGASVIMLASQIGSIAGCEAFSTPSYAISKAALHMATRQLGHALAGRGITVAAISPGWVRTDMGGPDATTAPGQSIAKLLALVDRLPLEGAPVGPLLTRDGAPIPW